MSQNHEIEITLSGQRCRSGFNASSGISFSILGWIVFLAMICNFFSVAGADAQVLTSNTEWSGSVKISEDILVPKGIVLVIKPGTVITFASSESTKTDPEYISHLTELTVRGTLRAEGSKALPIEFKGETGAGEGRWAGVLIDGGEASLRFCTLKNAETAVQVFAGRADLDSSIIRENRYGLVAQGKDTHVRMNSTVIRENDFGESLFAGAAINETESVVLSNNKRDRTVRPGERLDSFNGYTLNKNQSVTRIYNDEVLKGEVVWRGKIQVSGQLRVPESSRLIIMPGTVVEFVRRDTNGDGIGESGLLIQGVLIAKGTPEMPIFFRSAEKVPSMGDWDSINLMNSDGVRNLIEYCQIEDAYRGVHFHYSSVITSRSIFRNSYRGVQFQESQVELRNNIFYGNKSAVQGRDSEVVFIGNLVKENLRGVNILRSGFFASSNRFSGNAIDGLRIRDTSASIEKNTFDSNRYGLMAQDSYYGKYASNLVSGNLELGFSLKNLENLEIHENYFTGNGTNGISLQEVTALIRGNSFTDNSERGIGIVSFDGTITGNNFASNGIYALDLESSGDVSAPANWWGGDSPGSVIFDGADLKERGRVDTRGDAKVPFPFNWQINEIPVDLHWRGAVVAKESITVPAGVTLGIAPGSRIFLGVDVSLLVRGKLRAKGEKGARIRFSSPESSKPGHWGEILFERATDSVVDHCDFRDATWALHSHFTNLVVTDSLFENNYGGIRFRSGPMGIYRSSFKGNEIGIRSYRGVGLIKENEITGNDIGIFVREKGGGLNIQNNDLSGNSRYAVRIGDFNDEDVKAPENWWGSSEPGDSIFDARQEEGVGFVRYQPALTVKPAARIME